MCNPTKDHYVQVPWTKGHWPLDDLWPQVCWGHMCDSTQGSLWLSPMKIHQSMWIQWSFFLKIEPKVIDPYMTFDPKSVEVTCVTLPKDHCVQVPWKYIKDVDTVTLFSKTWTKGHWRKMTFDHASVKVTCVTLPKDHCVQVPWEYINVCGYNDQFCKIPHT